MRSNVKYNKFLPWENDLLTSFTGAGPDDRSGLVYLHDASLQLAAETAIVTQRPLLIRGEPGSGKSSFASFAARNLNWRYYETTITGRTEAKDLLWKFDALARLRDAQAKSKDIDIDPINYVTPGVLWWAFNCADAIEFLSRKRPLRRRGDQATSESLGQFEEINRNRDQDRAVILIDEIDKADPDVPNDLLEVFGLNRFNVDELNRNIERKIPATVEDPRLPNDFGSLFVVITTNQERDLPPAFLRRCIAHTLEEPKDQRQRIERLVKIAYLHMKHLIESRPGGNKLVRSVAEKCCQLQREAQSHYRRGPSVAEFLDAVKVCFKLRIDAGSPFWQHVERNVLIKEGDWKINEI
jgi:MoxR-like ATPase